MKAGCIGWPFLSPSVFDSFNWVQVPLTDSEAALALQALHIAQGQSPLLGPSAGIHPFYQHLLCHHRKHKLHGTLCPSTCGERARICSLFLSREAQPAPGVDPCLPLCISTRAGGTFASGKRNDTGSDIPAVRLGDVDQRTRIPAGVFAGLALLSGPSLWAGLLDTGTLPGFSSGEWKQGSHLKHEEQSAICF